MPTDSSNINAFWAGEPKNRIGKTVKIKSKSSRKRKRVSEDLGDGSTGMFDNSDDSSQEDEPQSGPAQLKRVGQHELFSLAAHRKVFSEAWSALLGLGLAEDDIKRVLVMLHRQIMPHLVEPSILIDFLADCCDYGGTLALLALNGLFTLISRHRLYVRRALGRHCLNTCASAATIQTFSSSCIGSLTRQCCTFAIGRASYACSTLFSLPRPCRSVRVH